MPRDGSQRYSTPFPPVEEDTTIDSGVYNGTITDIALDLNAPRPILSGGTGADNKRDAMVNLDGEIAKQLVTNYDSHPWVPGSFYSANTTGLPGAPVDGHAFSGIVYMTDNNNIVLEARDQSDTAVPSKIYVREKKAGVWGVWSTDTAALEGGKLDIAGDTMTGGLGISTQTPFLILNRTVLNTGQGAYVGGALLTKPRWSMFLGDATPETATDKEGSNFTVTRFDNAGVVVDKPIEIARLDGVVKINGKVKVNVDGDTMTGPLALPAVFPSSATHAANKDYVDRGARIVSLNTGVHTYINAGHAGMVLGISNAAASYFIVQTQAVAPMPAPQGTQIDLINWGCPDCRAYAQPGVTLLSEDNRFRLRTTWSTATLLHLGGDSWLVTGSLIP